MRCEGLIGRKFGRLLVTGVSKRKSGTNRCVWCLCDCGTVLDVQWYRLISGKTKSCGCLQREQSSKCATVHGMEGTPEYKSWQLMKNRCFNPNYEGFHRYGGRGITVCPEWLHDFAAFYAHIGPKPEPKRLYSVDRINNDGNYEPGNVRWATAKEQRANSHKPITQ